MKAARFHGPADIRIEDIPAPELRPGAVTINRRHLQSGAPPIAAVGCLLCPPHSARARSPAACSRQMPVR
ncbi:hypothetical protein E3T39_05995 [Cryobacterium suzukii]|uniref:Uncharacterized protein n=1 Tax=Cryobacterium suzukii TaxID=1259198 RepID=A0A4R9AGG7_9MICO|nr:hypothetical protein E3T39_05995 [Cryobacterium suzukii]